MHSTFKKIALFLLFAWKGAKSASDTSIQKINNKWSHFCFTQLFTFCKKPSENKFCIQSLKLCHQTPHSKRKIELLQSYLSITKNESIVTMYKGVVEYIKLNSSYSKKSQHVWHLDPKSFVTFAQFEILVVVKKYLHAVLWDLQGCDRQCATNILIETNGSLHICLCLFCLHSSILISWISILFAAWWWIHSMCDWSCVLLLQWVVLG